MCLDNVEFISVRRDPSLLTAAPHYFRDNNEHLFVIKDYLSFPTKPDYFKLHINVKLCKLEVKCYSLKLRCKKIKTKMWFGCENVLCKRRNEFILLNKSYWLSTNTCDPVRDS